MEWSPCSFRSRRIVTIAYVIVEELIGWFGVPHLLLTHKCSNFSIKSSKLLEIGKARTTNSRPQSGDRMVEHFNRTLESVEKCLEIHVGFWEPYRFRWCKRYMVYFGFSVVAMKDFSLGRQRYVQLVCPSLSVDDFRESCNLGNQEALHWTAKDCSTGLPIWTNSSVWPWSDTDMCRCVTGWNSSTSEPIMAILLF